MSFRDARVSPVAALNQFFSDYRDSPFQSLI